MAKDGGKTFVRMTTPAPAGSPAPRDHRSRRVIVMLGAAAFVLVTASGTCVSAAGRCRADGRAAPNPWEVTILHDPRAAPAKGDGKCVGPGSGLTAPTNRVRPPPTPNVQGGTERQADVAG
ncbi:unnamed protein product [Lampetra planeri]